MKKKIWNILTAAAFLIMAVGVMTAFHACDPKEDGTWMNCHNAQMTVFYISLAAAAVSLAVVFIRSKVVLAIANLICIVLSLVAILVPGTIVRMCMMNTMRCYTMLKPFVLVTGILAIVFSVPGFIRVFSGKK